MSNDIPEGYVSKQTVAIVSLVVAAVAVAVTLIVRLLLSPSIANPPHMPKDSPIEVAGNSAHVCTPSLPTSATPTIPNNTEAYLAAPDGSNRQGIAITRPWKSIRINYLGNDQSAIDVVAGVAGDQGIPIVITPHFQTKTSSDGSSYHSVCQGGGSECVQLGDIIFNDARGNMITTVACENTPPGGSTNPGKCLLFLGPLKDVSTAYSCINQ